MKKLLFTLAISISMTATVQSQSLENTSWAVYDSSGVLFYYFRFETDTLFASSDNLTYSPQSLIHITLNLFTVNDMPTGPLAGCPLADTGHYSFINEIDTLKLTLIADACVPRALAMSSYFWVSLTSGIQTTNSNPELRVFPNPSTDGVFNFIISNMENDFKELEITTAEGKCVLKERLSEFGNRVHPVNLSDFPAGVYFLNLRGNQGNKVFKLIK